MAVPDPSPRLLARRKNSPPRHTTTPPANALFRILLKGAGDAETAYTATREIQSMAGQNVTTELVARMDTLQARTDQATTELTARMDMHQARTDQATTELTARMDMHQARTDQATTELGARFEAALKAAVTELRTELKSAVREVRTDLRAEIAVRADSLEKQIRLTWAFLTLQAVTLTAVLVRLFAG